MDPNALKTSLKQRIIIAAIAILLLGSTIATYILIVLSSSNSGDAKLEKLQDEYTAKQVEINEYGRTLSEKYFDTLNSFRSEIKGYNAEAVNGSGVKKTDLKEGDGRELTSGDLDYFAYFFGWCPDGSTPSEMSTFDTPDNPTLLVTPAYAGQGMIAGWNEGVIGMKIGGVREIAIPSELAYGETKEVCGMINSPLKFVVMPIADDKLTELNNELENIYSELIQAYYSSSAYTSSSTGGSSTVTE